MPKGYFVCHTCGKRVDYDVEERPCEVFSGWLTISQWKGLGMVEHYNFCSFTCLKSWVDIQTPKIPDIFLKAFETEKDQSSGK